MCEISLPPFVALENLLGWQPVHKLLRGGKANAVIVTTSEYNFLPALHVYLLLSCHFFIED
jgi:hypothetical protein